MKLFSLCIPSIWAHSWIACTDYGEKNAAHYDHAKCRGWPRLASQYAPIGGTFGGDTGYDTRPQSGTTPCASARSNNDYTGGHFEAVYFPGQQVVLAHPMKNHGASTECTNKYIPDNGNWLYAKPMTAAGQPDPNLGEFKQNEVVDLSVSPVGHSVPDSEINSYPKPGFQNAPAFCEDTNLALGTYSFNVPADMEPGEYTFVWLWAFNSATDYYSTCFEVIVADNAQAREATLAGRGQTDFSLPCDTSPTSNGEAGSLVGCNGQVTTPPPPPPSTQQPTQTQAPQTSQNPMPTGQPPAGGDMGYVISTQMTGKIILPGPDEPPARREIHVRFYADCAEVARPNFWYARLDHKHDQDGNVLHRFRRSDGGSGDASVAVHYVLFQESQEDIQRGYVGFHWAFETGCRMLQYPTDVHVVDIL